MKSVIRSIKNEINNYDDGERLVRELTSNESNAPPQELLVKLKIMLTDQYMFGSAIRMLFKRLRDYNNIRHVEKALICIEYLIKNGDRKFVRYCQMDANAIAKLQRYRYILNMQDYGQNIRKRAKRITTLLKHDSHLREQRAKAQGYSMDYKNKQKKSTSNKRTKQSSANTAHQSSANAKKKKKTKKKKATKKVENNASQEPQFASLIDIPPENNNASANFDNNNNNGSDDLLSGDWWNTGDNSNDAFDPFNDVNNGNDNAQGDPMSGFGDDGGQFGFGDDNDFENENKDNEEDDKDVADSWMTSLTTMDNVLEGNVSKKDNNKVNKKGKSMASMAGKGGGSSNYAQNMPTNDPFAAAPNNDSAFDPFGANEPAPATGLSALYQQSKAAPQANPFGGGGAPAQNNFGYQGKSSAMPYANDPFVGIGAPKNQKVVQPATYVPRKKQSDPFAQFGSM